MTEPNVTTAGPDAIRVSTFQAKILAVPPTWDVILLGGRGGGKSTALALLLWRYCERYGSKARCLVIRRHHRGLEDFVSLLGDLLGKVYGRAVRFNSAAGTFKLPGGGYIECNQMDAPSSWTKFQGRSFGIVAVEEGGEFAAPGDLDKLRSCLRAPAGVPCRFVLTANPGGPGHGWIRRRYMRKAEAFAPFTCADSDRVTVTCPSTIADNEHLDRAEYESQLRAACGNDRELLKAWLTGSWDIARGAYFADVLDEHCVAVPAWPTPEAPAKARVPRAMRFTPSKWGIRQPLRSKADRARGSWRYVLGHDFGVAAPSYTVLAAVARGGPAVSPDGRSFSRDSVILIRELSSADPSDPSRGMGWTVPVLAEYIKEMAYPFQGGRPHGYMDDAQFSRTGGELGSIADQFAHHGISWTRAMKGQRVAGWAIMREMIEAAGTDKAGLYVCEDLSSWWDTVPVLPRDPRRPEDCDTRANDHAADATRYLVGRGRRGRVSIKQLG